MSTITVNNPIYDKVHMIRAWDDNNFALKLVQGEGIAIPEGSTSITVSHIKAPRFQLTDWRGAIDLSGASEISWAIIRPQGGGEDLLACNTITASDGIIEIPITVSATAYVGDVYGEIRVITDGGLIKFGGINACVGEGVSDEAAAQSSRFSDLLDALQQVVALQGSGNVADMDALVNGDLKSNGTNPVSSGNLKTYLEGNYQTFLKARYYAFDYAHESHSSTYTTDNPVDTYSDGGVYIDDATDLKKVYQVKNTNGTVHGFLLCSTVPGALNSYSITQYFFEHNGGAQYRVRTVTRIDENTIERVWGDWIKFETRASMDTVSGSGSISSSDNKYPSSKLVSNAIDQLTGSINNLNSYKLQLQYAYPDDCTDTQMRNITNGVRLKDATSPNTLYLVRSGSGITNGDLRGFLMCASMSSNNGTQCQYFFNRGGEVKIRTRENNTATWGDWQKLSGETTKRATATLSSGSWSNSTQPIDVSSVYTLTSNTKVDIDVDSTNFAIIQSSGCNGIYLETNTNGNSTTLIAKAIGAIPTSDVEIQLLFSETNDLGSINGGGI